ncbi:NDP-sugar epimerase, includes UDP-GlcNAc-inverting 4,6-dehydratase FlaA1 and capsular polysaccharide biosynthesis protein EpsC [Desulfurobacterium pacificum]|uniref:NDP-sugar epimerase, includes UDP-GlcNAc-inverting 4,6-dehydratase FlaA1 and capsular polysaccharide biosynthesis protein EpsC n=1 Tax=Desulfurobacterium pacificum TaxID=240166 RepID=A0ABY1NNR3_9BACT|nr:nucleoside-diphosphate sugar epimerase/dehydratase [Desulfurobacterium pacificum]SMP14006.1 NDP-sugar epimerase, includes UDP-GlcNAc-inverting 4,6-dehydratase FlaA1 and capsular polysaccharide biosynthesis protein EpsC [Desulfurobacterium pacificum]
MKGLLRPTKRKRFLFFFVSDIFLFTFSFYIAFLLRFNFLIPSSYLKIFPYWLVVILFLKISTFWFLGVYRANWRFIGLSEFSRIVIGLGADAILMLLIDIIFQRQVPLFSIPLSVILIDFFVSLSFVSVLRISKRVYVEIIRKGKNSKRTVVIGAGNTGERIVRELRRNSNAEFNPVFFVDDDPNKIGTCIHNVPVLGKIEDLPGLLKENKIEAAIITIPSLSHRKVRKIFALLNTAGIKEVKIVPSISKLPSQVISVKDIKEISIEDLLCREPVNVNYDSLQEFLKDKKVLVTGAGGSIGSEIIRQLLKFNPAKIIALEIDETELHNLSLEIANETNEKGITFRPIVADVRDKEKIERIFSEEKPEIVFHAAAYKHVPLMEYFPEEAVKTNILGTYNVALAAVKNNVEKFVNISTDKAVNPTSIMGATKRMSEMICKALNDIGKTKFISVRFGNVLGSRGSVVPIFLDQIKKGGPVTVTHPEMRRYFMTIPEAVLLVFQAAAMGDGGEVFVLDMGEPVRIVKLAEELIKLQGLEPYKDIDIVFIGLRPGEKLFEELLTAEEGTEQTYHEKIYIARVKSNIPVRQINEIVNELIELSKKLDREGIKQLLRKYVPFYKNQDNTTM